MCYKQSERADKKAGTRHQRTRVGIRQVLKVLNPAHMPPVDTMKHHHERHTRRHTHTPHFKYIFAFYTLLSPKFPRKHQSEQIKSNFCHVSPCSGRKYATMERGTHHQRRTTPEAYTPATSRHAKRQASRATTCTHFAPTFQIYLYISPLVVSENPEKTQKHTKNLFTFAPFCPVSMPFCPGGVMEDSERCQS